MFLRNVSLVFSPLHSVIAHKIEPLLELRNRTLSTKSSHSLLWILSANWLTWTHNVVVTFVVFRFLSYLMFQYVVTCGCITFHKISNWASSTQNHVRFEVLTLTPYIPTFWSYLVSCFPLWSRRWRQYFPPKLRWISACTALYRTIRRHNLVL